MRLALWIAMATPILLAAAAPLSAQTTPTVTVIGVVFDAQTRTPVSAARVSVGGPGVATNALGRFQLDNVPLGSRRILVMRLGYQDLEVVLNVTDPMGGVQLLLVPAPVQLEGISSTGATEGPLRGRVIDAATAEPVPWAPVTITRNGVTEVSRRASRANSTNTDGDFTIPDLPIGRYVLKIERPDYQPKLININHEVPGAPLQITLSRDVRRAAALEVLAVTLDERKNATGGPSVGMNAAALQSTATPFMDQLQAPAGFTDEGVVGTSGLTVFIDGVKQDQGILQTFSPKAFYRVDFIGCPGSARARYLLAYTYEYIEDRMLNPAKRDLMLQTPLCLP